MRRELTILNLDFMPMPDEINFVDAFNKSWPNGILWRGQELFKAYRLELLAGDRLAVKVQHSEDWHHIFFSVTPGGEVVLPDQDPRFERLRWAHEQPSEFIVGFQAEPANKKRPAGQLPTRVAIWHGYREIGRGTYEDCCAATDRIDDLTLRVRVGAGQRATQLDSIVYEITLIPG